MRSPTSLSTFQYGKLQWLDITEPTEKTLDFLREKYGFHELDLEDCLSEHQRPKIDEYDDYLFIVLQFPFYDKRRKRVVSEEVDIFIGQDFLITLHDGNLKALIDLVRQCEDEKASCKEIMSQGTGYLLYVIIRGLFNSVFPLLDDLARSLSAIERDIFEGVQQDLVKDILWLKKDVINCRRIISPQRAVVAQLEHKNKKFLPEDLEVYFDDVVDKIEKMWSTLENQKELTETLNDTNEALISHQTNRVIKMLTVFSVILMPLTVVTGFFGMNVGLPQAERELAWLGIAGGMLAVVAIMLIFFKWKRWL